MWAYDILPQCGSTIKRPLLQIGTLSHRFDHPRLNTSKPVFTEKKMTLAVGTALNIQHSLTSALGCISQDSPILGDAYFSLKHIHTEGIVNIKIISYHIR